ncbi:MarR family winged helix-turn-helix transcriptional regulator [Ferrimonas senticii]|uniref:MarR family winged helix-turn-helix transcriptional regulator n=1 Tax=Ferrimonas senticii TaxID=394566 RepID=UPI00048167D3|nr:MarR family transcriptional regulator [Ferrimonas senticii]
MDPKEPRMITGIEELDRNPMFLMGLVYKQFRAQVAQQLSVGCEISLEMFGALRVLQQHGQITQQQLADYLMRDRSVTKRLADNAIKLGLVQADKSNTNKKIKLLSLTTAGEQQLAHSKPLVAELNQQFRSPLSDAEQQQLQQLLSKLVRVDLVTD